MAAAGTWFANRTLPLEAQMHRLSLALAWGTVAGALLQVGIQLPACWRLLHGIAVRVSVAPEGVRGVLAAWLPLVLGAGVAQVSGFVDTLLGSFTGPGGVSALGYAQLVQVLPVSLFGVSVAAVSLPELSRDATTALPNELLRARIATAFRRVTFFVLPSAFAFAALGPVIVGALFQTGRFGADDTALVGGVLAAYGVGLVGQATVKLFASGFYALRDTRTPVMIAICRSSCPRGSPSSSCAGTGRRGLPSARHSGATLNVVLNLLGLDRRIGAVLASRRLASGGRERGCRGSCRGGGPSRPRIQRRAPGRFSWPLSVSVFLQGTYLALAMALKHPDAARLWKLVS